MTIARISLLGDESAAAAESAGVPAYLSEVNLYRALLNHPLLARPIADLVVFLWRKSALDARLRELAIMRVAWRTRCEYEWAHHWVIAQRSGLSEVELASVQQGSDAGCFGPRERAVLDATDDTLTDGSVSDTTWRALAAHLVDENTILELLATISTWRAVSELIQSLRLPLESGFSAWPPNGIGPAARSEKNDQHI